MNQQYIDVIEKITEWLWNLDNQRINSEFSCTFKEALGMPDMYLTIEAYRAKARELLALTPLSEIQVWAEWKADIPKEYREIIDLKLMDLISQLDAIDQRNHHILELCSTGKTHPNLTFLIDQGKLLLPEKFIKDVMIANNKPIKASSDLNIFEFPINGRSYTFARIDQNWFQLIIGIQTDISSEKIEEIIKEQESEASEEKDVLIPNAIVCFMAHSIGLSESDFHSFTEIFEIDKFRFTRVDLYWWKLKIIKAENDEVQAGA